MPVSETSIHTRPAPSRPAATSMVPPSGVYLMELETTFIITWVIRSLSAVISGSPGSSLAVRVCPCRWASKRLALTMASMASAKEKVVRLSSLRPESNRDRVSRSWTMWVIRSVSVMMMSKKPLAVSRGMSCPASRSVSA